MIHPLQHPTNHLMLITILSLSLSACTLIDNGGSLWPETRSSPASAVQISASNPVADDPEYTDPVLLYYLWLEDAEPAALALEKQYLEYQYREHGDPVTGLQLAMLLSFGEAGNKDARLRAEGILQSLLEQDAFTEQSTIPQHQYHAFARLWYGALDEQRELRARLERTIRQNEELEQRNEELRQQIEALRAIEQQLNLREQLQDIP